MSRFNQAGKFINSNQRDIFMTSAINDHDLSVFHHLIA